VPKAENGIRDIERTDGKTELKRYLFCYGPPEAGASADRQMQKK